MVPDKARPRVKQSEIDLGAVTSPSGVSTSPEHRDQLDFDEIVTFACTHLQTPMAAISLLDGSEGRFLSSVGVKRSGFDPKDSFCQHVVANGRELIVADATKIKRFAKLPLVREHPNVRFYAGVPIQVGDECVGVMCVLDDRPRSITPRQLGVLRFLGHQVQHLMELHRRRNAAEPALHGATRSTQSEPSPLVLETELSSQEARSDELERAAHVDSLTGLANRRQFIRKLREQLTDQDGPVTIFFIDLDRFKMVNDTMGHDAGDALLGAAAARILACTPEHHLVARLGGDEFAVLHRVNSKAEAKSFAERLRIRLEHPFQIDGCEYHVSASVGIAMSNPDSTPKSLLAEADAAMYAVKDAGRNASAFFDLELRQQMTEWSEIQRDLRHAIDNHEMDLYLQPILDFTGGAVVYESLARWNHPVRGHLLPGTFIDVAEESGLINRLGSHLLSMGAQYSAELHAPVSINVSGRQFNRNLVQQVSALISRHNLAGGQLIIEVTESAVVDTDHARVVLDGLRDAGASIWIDDFGTGFSSLARLNSLTVDGLKLAREFVASLDSQQGWGIATAIVGLARALNIKIIAEGVETERQLEQIRLLGCDSAQGYLLGSPVAFHDRSRWPSLRAI